MHPLLDNLSVIKNKLLQLETGGFCLDIFSLPNDMQIHSSSNFSQVLCVARTEKDMKYLEENKPSRPPCHVRLWDLTSTLGQSFFDTAISFLGSNDVVSTIWIHMYRCAMSEKEFSGLIHKLSNRCGDFTTLYILCVDGALAKQYAKSHIVYIDKNNEMHMQYHKQSIECISVQAINRICDENGFIHKNSIRGDKILEMCNINILPYDLWSSQTFFLLQFKSKFHFQRFV